MNKKGELGMKKIVPFKKEIIFKTNVSEITSISLEHNLHLGDNNLITGNFIISGEYRIADTSINTEMFNFELPFDINVDDKYDLTNVNVDIDDFYYEIVNNKSLEVNIEVLIDKLLEKPLIEPREENKSLEEISDTDENVINIENEDNIAEKIQINEEDREENDEKEDEIMERCIEKEDILAEFDSLDNVSDSEVNNTVDKLDEKRLVELSQKTETKSIEKINSLFDNLDSSTETYKTYKVCIIRTGDTIESVLQKYSISKEELEKYNSLSDVKIGDKLIIPSVNDEKI